MIHVAVAVIENANGEILISKRHDHLHQGGLWEYPGGKVEVGEDVQTALAREIDEELGLHIQAVRPLIRVPHDYGDKQVLLDVFRVTEWSGQPHGREDQPLQWVAKPLLNQYGFPAANKPITLAVQLPPQYVITPEPTSKEAFLTAIKRLIESGCNLLQLRAKSLSIEQFESLASRVNRLCTTSHTQLLVNGYVELAEQLGCGVHLTSSQLQALTDRPLPASQCVAASCHTLDDLDKAARLDVDFVVISPVKQTASHPEATPLGWEKFAALCEQAVMPVYALGGMVKDDINQAQLSGAQGVAGIRGFWPE